MLSSSHSVSIRHNLRNFSNFFFIVSLFACGILIPVYGLIADSSKFSASQFEWNYSALDMFTLANAIDDFDTVKIILLMTYLFSSLAYYLLYVFSS